MIKITDEMREYFNNELWDINIDHPEWEQHTSRVMKRIIELHEANKPKPEPVGFISFKHGGWLVKPHEAERMNNIDADFRPLYTNPPTREPLSDDEMPVGRMAVNGVMLSPDCTTAFILGVRFAEHKHGIGTPHEPT